MPYVIPRVPAVCAFCSSNFMARAAAVKAGFGRFCSRACAGRSRTGDKNPNWNGGLIVGVDERVLVYCPGDPEAKLLGGMYALRYRLVARKKLGRPLAENEVVHHINGDPTDDRPENLEVTTPSAHMRFHLNQRRDPVTGQMSPKGVVIGPAPDRRKPCRACGALFEPHPRHRVRQKGCSPACSQRLRNQRPAESRETA